MVVSRGVILLSDDIYNDITIKDALTYFFVEDHQCSYNYNTRGRQDVPNQGFVYHGISDIPLLLFDDVRINWFHTQTLSGRPVHNDVDP